MQTGLTTIDSAALTVSAAPAAGQGDPTKSSPINFTVTFNKNVSDFTVSDVSFAGSTAGGPLAAAVTAGPATYDIAVSGMISNGAVTISVPAAGASDAAGNPNIASNTATVSWDSIAPAVTIDQASTQSDPTSFSPITFTAVFSEPVTGFGNCSVTLGGSAGATTASVSGGPTTYDVSVTGVTTTGTVIATIGAGSAADLAGNTNSASTSTDNTVTFNSVAGTNPPTVTITSPAFGSIYAKGAATINPLAMMATFTDPDAGQSFTWTINWDDGATSTGSIGSAAPKSIAETHAFTATGVFTINVTVCDDGSPPRCGSGTVWIVVYDPNGGFVTGGGWINVGVGSLTANPALTGRANFGFNSQYKKNATVPTGQTEFNFQVGNLNFHSEAYTWLVVSGFKAQFKGTGTINGSGNYDFTLTAYDGKINGGHGVDRFRIRITDGNNGNAVIFDNRNGQPLDIDTADPQEVAGGSINIKKA